MIVDGTGERTAESYNGVPASAPLLEVSYDVTFGTLTSDSAPLSFGTDEPTNAVYFDGIMDELRISDALRSADWIKAIYNSETDNLLSFGSEEVTYLSPTVTPGATSVDPSTLNVFGSSTTEISAQFTDLDDPGISDFTVTFKVRDSTSTEYTLVNNQTNGNGGLTITSLGSNMYEASYDWDPANDQTIGSYDLLFYVKDSGTLSVTDDYRDNTDELTLFSDAPSPPTLTGGTTTSAPTTVDISGSSTTTITANFVDINDPGVGDFTVTFKVRDSASTEYTLVNAQTNGNGGLTITNPSTDNYQASYTWDPAISQPIGAYDLYFTVVDGSAFSTTDSYDNNTNELTLTDTPEIPTSGDENWDDLGVQQNDATTDAVDIKNSGTTVLQYQSDSNFMYFQFFTEADPAMNSYVYAVLMDDGGDGTYNYCISTFGLTDYVSLYTWSAVYGWDELDVVLLGSDYFTFDTTNDVVQFAVPFSDAFIPAGTDKAYAVTNKDDGAAFEVGGEWEDNTNNNPTPADTKGDYTTAKLLLNQAPTLTGGTTTPAPTSIDISGAVTTTITSNFVDLDDPGVGDFTVTLKVRDTTDAEYTLVNAQTNGNGGLTITNPSANNYQASYTWDPAVSQAIGTYDLYFYVVDSGADSVTDVYANNSDELTLTDTPEIPAYTDEGWMDMGGQQNTVWWNSDWSYRKKITIDNTKVDSTLSNFPVLVKIDSTADLNFANVEGSSGQDIRFTDSSGNPLYYEIERWNDGSNLAEIWVKIPSVSSSADTDFYMYYGNSGASDGQDATNVWDSNFKGVWHLDETGTGSRADSTSNSNAMTTSGYDGDEAITGKIDGADDLDGTNDYLSRTYDSDFDFGTGGFSASGWFNTGGTSATSTISVKVNAGSDDAEENTIGGSVSTGSSDLEFIVDTNTQIIGIRFNSVNVPQGTTITNAYIQFTADSSPGDATAITLTVNGEDTDNSATFDSGTTNDISDRTTTTASVSWSPSQWSAGSSGSAEQTSDIKTVIQEIVDRSGWSSGNSLSIIISEGSGSGLRRAESYDGAANSEPELFITYKIDQHLVSRYDNDQGFKVWMRPDGKISFGLDDDSTWGPDNTLTSTSSYKDSSWHHFTAVKSSNNAAYLYVDGAQVASNTDLRVSTDVSVRVSTGNDDAEEQNPPNGYMDLGSGDLELVMDGSDDQEVGMRFQVAIPQGATINSAYIQFTCDETSSGTTNLVFTGEDTDNAATFSISSGDITSRTETTASVNWNSVPSWSIGEAGANQKTPDLKTIIQEIVDRGGWASGNSLVIIVDGSGSRTAESYNGDSSAAPLLEVNYSHFGTLTSDSAPLSFGSDEPTNAKYFDGIMDELRISDTLRSSAWIETSYYSDDDSLLTFNSQETSSSYVDIDIINSGNTKLQYQSDNNFMYFQFFTEADPDMDGYTYSVLMDDGAEGTYDYCIATDGDLNDVKLYTWSAVNGWDNVDVVSLGADYFTFDTTNDFVQFVVPFADSFTPVSTDKAYAATYLSQADAFEEGKDWESTNNPTPAATVGDYTAPTAIPEFSGVTIPMFSVSAIIMIAGKKERLRKKKLGKQRFTTAGRNDERTRGREREEQRRDMKC